MTKVLGIAEFTGEVQPLIDQLTQVSKTEFQAFLTGEIRFPVSIKYLPDGSEWYLYWRSQDVLAAAAFRELENGELVAGARCYIQHAAADA